MERHTCSTCGSELPPNALFCTECGAAVASAFDGGAVLPEPERISPGFSPEFSPESPREDEILVSREEIAAPQPETEKSGKSGQPLATKILIGTASAFMSLILFASVTAGQAEFIARRALSERSIAAMVEKLDFNEINVYENESLTETIYESIDEYYKITFGVDEEKIGKLLQSDMVRDFVTGKAVDIAGYVIGETAKDEIITSKEVIDFLKRNSDEIEIMTGYKLTDSDYADILAELDMELEEANWDAIMKNSPIKKDTARLTFSIYAFATSIAATIIFAALIFIINRRKTSAFYYCGYAFGISGLAVTVSSFALGSLFAVLAEASGMRESLVNSILTDVRNTVMLTGLSVFGFGALLIAVAAVSRKIIKSKATKANGITV